MKAITQVLTIAKDAIGHVITPAIEALSKKLLVIYAAPVNAEFGHFLFESIAAIISVTCKPDTANINTFEEALFPIFQKILTEPGAGTFAPYVFQVMSQFIELRGNLDPKYLVLLPVLTEVHHWEEVGNRPALVRLIQDFIIFGPATFNSDNLMPILGIFQKLLSNKQQDYLAFFLLESIVSSLDKTLVGQYMPQIFKLIFTRLQSSKTEPLVRSFILFLSNFIATSGVSFVMEQLNNAQNGIFSMILTSLWIPNISKISGKAERKAIACGTISLLSSDLTGTFFQNDQGASSLRDLISSLILLFTGETSNVAADSSYVDAGELVYNSGFNALKMATKLPTDYFAKIENAQAFFAATMKDLSTKYGQKFAQILSALSGENQTSFMAILKSANVTL
jgi:exportin-2 (importin alpha re-exporter)